uniref:MIF4G domain-containing protein B n=2 Tax=Cacopsylla melanoneura TaxID=428564 RepID=A0A8D9EVZ8_9HEMI
MPGRGKQPTLEIYRPPNVRSDGPGNNRLNVHAKEFIMNLQNSRSSGNLYSPGIHFPTHAVSPYDLYPMQMMPLRHSPSAGGLLHNPPGGQYPGMVGAGLLQHSGSGPAIQHSTSGILHSGKPKVHFSGSNLTLAPKDRSSKKVSITLQNNVDFKTLRAGLQRSKSLSAANDVKEEVPDIGKFSADIQHTINQAVRDPNKVDTGKLMQLAKLIVERATEDKHYSFSAARLCIMIIEKEVNDPTFLDALINTCQMWYQQRETLLKYKPYAYSSYISFLNQTYLQLKRSQLHLKSNTFDDDSPPTTLLLNLIGKSCQDSLLRGAHKSVTEVESLFFVITTIGKDLEAESPQVLKQLFNNIRDIYIFVKSPDPVKKTLLQLIELHAAKWQLPASALRYYYPAAGIA